MKQTALLLLLSLLATTSLAQKASKEEAAIRAAMQAQEAAWNAGDIKRFVELSYVQGDSTLFMGSNGPRYGYANILKTYRNSYGMGAQMGKLTFEIIQVQVTGKTSAYVVGKYHLVRSEATYNGYYLLVLQKTKAGWRIQADYSNNSDED